MSSLEARDVTVTFGATRVLDHANLSMVSGEIVALVGPSGSGKSTLLRVIAGILPPDDGQIRVDDLDVSSMPTHQRGIGMVFQDNQLFPHMSTIDNVMFGPKMAGASRAERSERANLWLERVGLSEFGERSVTELSGGEAKRVALARTMAAEPAVVLLDEPLTGLDRELHDRLVDDLGTLLRAAKVTTLLVTHDVDEAAAIADRTVALADLVAAAGGVAPTAG